MSASRTGLRWFMWAVVAIVAIPVALYLFALVVNWQDEPPSSEARELAIEVPREPVPDSANAYVYMLGFAVPHVGDPALVGASRAEWIRSRAASAAIDRASDPYPGSAPEFQHVPEALAAVLTPCGMPDAKCAAAFDAAIGNLREHLEEQRPLIERYRTLLGLSAWREVTTGDTRGPFVSFSEVGYARRLFLLDTWLIAASGDAGAVRGRLEADLKLWRMALAESDWLLDKAIAASYVGQHFTWGNLILRRLPPERRADGIPDGWRRPITDVERSMQSTLANEWRVLNGTIRFMKTHGLTTPEDIEGRRSALDRIETALEVPLLQPQATANRHAAVLAKLAKVLSLPYADLGPALARAADLDEPPKGVFAVTYNLLGTAMATPQPEIWANYGARVADLEGARRAAVLAVDLRVLKIPPELAAAMIPLAATRDPYTGGPFVWTAEPGMVSFTGVERISSTRYKFLY